MSLTETTQALFTFLHSAPSPFHAAAHAAALLRAAGYRPLEETQAWSLHPGQGYYVTRNGSSLIAWRMPAGPICGWRLAASHGDAPTWRVKNLHGQAQGVCRLNVEGYGGMLMGTWLDRPLTVAGRLILRTADGLQSRLVCPQRALLVIPSLAIHMDRTANEGHKFEPQAELQPLCGPEGCTPLAEVLAAEAGVTAADIVDADLTLAVCQAPAVVGSDGDWFLAPRIDDLACAATTLFGFLQAAPDAGDGAAPVWMLFDSEEVGSGTRQGAQSTFARDTLDRILAVAGQAGVEAAQRVLANSFCLSADNAHATHPAHPELADPANPVRLGGGVVLKYNAGQRYVTTGLSGAVFREICRRSDVPLQVFANRAGRRGGSTLGHLLGLTVPVPMVDIGLPQLAMHAAVETAALADAEAMVRAVAGFYRAALRAAADGAYTL